MLKMTQLIFYFAQLVQIPKSVNKMSVLFQWHRATLIQQTVELHWKRFVYLNSGLINRLVKSYLLCFRQKLLIKRSRLSKKLL
jgi:hypothetical protein